MQIKSIKFKRLLEPPVRSFLLLGPRGTGKSTWLKTVFKPMLSFDLLNSDQFFRFQASPASLREQVGHLKPGDWVVIDEVQRVPELLNEVHYLYENKGLQFALSGSSARKLKRANANLLAGRALRCDFFPLTWQEIQTEDLLKGCIDFGTLPHVVNSQGTAAETLSSYVGTYLKEEVASEALTRTLEPFARFLKTAAQHHAQLLNVESIASDAALKRSTVDNYFQILEDTLLGFRLPALRLGLKSKEVAHSKFYFFDAGVARAAAGWAYEDIPDIWRGFSFETLVLNEIRVYNSYFKKEKNLYHYTVTNSFDADVVVEAEKKILNRKPSYIGIQIKMSKKWNHSWSKNMNDLIQDPKSRMMSVYGVYLGDEAMKSGAMKVLGFSEFCRRLWNGEIF